jgi:hypothetical protein
MRNFCHFGDEIPGLDVCNTDVVGSLFISYCMQSSPSTWTILEIMTADIVMDLALRDLERLVLAWATWSG